MSTLVVLLLWFGIIGLGMVVTRLVNAAADRRRAANDVLVRQHQLEAQSKAQETEAKAQHERAAADAQALRRQQEATELATSRLESLQQKLVDPALTPLGLFPDVADAVADFVKVQVEAVARALDTKLYRARKAAEETRELAQRFRATTKESRLARYKVALYEREAPWLADILEVEFPTDDETQDVDADPEDDASRHFLSSSEFSSLSSAERNQLALDRYWLARKRNWQVGRDYERYIGYLWESRGYSVEYHGIEEGLQDLGRDLLARRGEELVVIQCKHWATFRTVRERHVYQLFGTALEMALAQQAPKPAPTQLALFPELLSRNRIQPRLVTSTTISLKAKEVAAALGVRVEEAVPMLQSYPCIKCNVSRATEERIYHLPFDQQYDRVLVEPGRGERYVSTCAEAERLGFRRAFRWRGGPSQNAGKAQ